MDGPFLPDSFATCSEAGTIARFLLFEDPEQRFLVVRQARIAYLLQQPALMLRGEPADALIAQATVQGTHRQTFPFFLSRFVQQTGPLDPLEFVIYVDAAAWQRRAMNPELGLSRFPIEQEALIYHELLHLRQLHTGDGDPRYHDDGREMLALRSHTYEFFDHEIRRYGPITTQLEGVGTDFVIGAATEKERTRPKLRRVK